MATSCSMPVESRSDAHAGGAQEILGTGHDPDLPIIAKIELPIVQDCAVYASGPDTIAPGSIDIGPVPE